MHSSSVIFLFDRWCTDALQCADSDLEASSRACWKEFIPDYGCLCYYISSIQVFLKVLDLLISGFSIFKSCYGFIIQIVPEVQWFELLFFDFTVVKWKWCVFSRNCTLNSELWFFPRLVICGRIFCDAGGRRELYLTVNQAVRNINNWYAYNHFVPLQPFSFSLLVQYSINYIRYSTVYYKIWFMLILPNCRLLQVIWACFR